MTRTNKKRKKDEIALSDIGNFVWEVVKIFVFSAMIIIPVRTFLFQPFLVQGASMAPNFHGGEYVIVNEMGYKDVSIGDLTLVPVQREFHRGDPIVFRFPNDPKVFFIKRVVGLPGEKITIHNGVVTIYNDVHPDGFVLEEEYLPQNYDDANGDVEYTVGNDEYFVMGDNRNNSYDSRAWGPLDKDLVMGKVLIRIWPFSKFKIYTID